MLSFSIGLWVRNFVPLITELKLGLLKSLLEGKFHGNRISVCLLLAASPGPRAVSDTPLSMRITSSMNA